MAKQELLSDIDIDLKGLERFKYNFLLDKKFKDACVKKYKSTLDYVMNYRTKMSEEVKKEYWRIIYKIYDFDRVQKELEKE